MKYYSCEPAAFSTAYLNDLRGEIKACRYFTTNNLNRDFVGTKGFSIVFTRAGLPTVELQFPFFKPYLNQVLHPTCNAFYLNPLMLQQGSHVAPHIDRSLRSYCKTIEPPMQVSVLYVEVPADLHSGELVLRRGNQTVAQIRPQLNLLLHFQGDLTHSVNAMTSPGIRLSLVCEQYSLGPDQLWDIPEFQIESRAAAYVSAAKLPKGKSTKSRRKTSCQT